MNRTCALCEKNAELLMSHVIPNFAIDWLRQQGGNLRSSQLPNKRVQDGEKLPLLCSDCEQMLSGWEKMFYESLFIPLHTNLPIQGLKYGPWALKFAVSVSWRVLLHLSLLSKKIQAIDQQALDAWRKFLLGKVQNPGNFEQHILPFNFITSCNGFKFSPFMNRYLALTVDRNIICSEKQRIVFTKMGKWFLFGFIRGNKSSDWKGTKLHVNAGFIANQYVIPHPILELINNRADKTAAYLASISPAQVKNIDKTIMANSDVLAGSDVLRAMEFDIAHSGKDAFQIASPRENEEHR